jgi:hypothetical protein
MGALRCSYL